MEKPGPANKKTAGKRLNFNENWDLQKSVLFCKSPKSEKIEKKGLSFRQSARIWLVKGQGIQQNHQCPNKKQSL
ncbi:MAG: hypothetical protein HDT27_10765 [Subdoligranulum sp.]|nr:hypothetical protein [Subdoligranulum sp.]